MSHSKLKYQAGFGNQFASEAVEGALPVGRNSPQKVAHGLYAELFSGTAFTAPREFVEGLHSMVVTGGAEGQFGIAAHLSMVTRSMTQRACVIERLTR